MKEKIKLSPKCLPIYRGLCTELNDWIHYLGFRSDEEAIQSLFINEQTVSVLEKITEVDEDWHISKAHVIWRDRH